MEKTITWNEVESVQVLNIDQEKTQVLAQIGSLMMDLEQARKNLDALNGRYRAVVNQALAERGIKRFENARPIQGGIVLQLPDKSSENGG